MQITNSLVVTVHASGENTGFTPNPRPVADKTVLIRGFDKFQEEDTIRNELTKFFSTCGEVQNVRIPTDKETGNQGVRF
jgi:RNA recognition motif-containing protein